VRARLRNGGDKGGDGGASGNTPSNTITLSVPFLTRARLCNGGDNGGDGGASGNTPSNTRTLSVPFLTRSMYFSFTVTLKNAFFSIRVAYKLFFKIKLHTKKLTSVTRCRLFKIGKTSSISCAIF
jgi:hypothetical protein